MKLEEFIVLFEQAVPEISKSRLKGSTRFRELPAWDSLAILMLTDSIDMECGVLMKKDDYAGCEDVESLYHLVESKMNGA